MSEQTIFCGSCNRAANIVSDADGDLVVCPECGQRDKAEDAMQIASDHAFHRAHVALQKGIRGDSANGTSEAREAASQTFRWQAGPD